MNFRFLVFFAVCASFLASCSRSQNHADTSSGAFKNFYQNLFQSQKMTNTVSGVWSNEWTNLDGYTVHEFLVVNPDGGTSFNCVLNPMGGLEYAPLRVQSNALLTTFIDPEKNVYVDQLSLYGKTNLDVKLNYDSSSDTFKWSTKLENSLRTYDYTRLTSNEKSTWDLFQSTCAKVQNQSAQVNTNTLKIEKLDYGEDTRFVSVLQKSTQSSSEYMHYCVFNPENNTVLSLPVTKTESGEIAFSNLDLLSARDYAKLFKSVSTKSITTRVPQALLTTCSALLDGTRALKTFENVDPFNLDPEVEIDSFGNFDSMSAMHTLNAGNPTSTYLTCKYKNAQNGSNSGWAWGEYPRWEWERQTQSCVGLFASNCVALNGKWTRDDQGLFAIGTMFIMDTDSQIESDFSRVCRGTNDRTAQKFTREYAQYHVADASYSFNHNVWFKQIRPDRPHASTLPFERIVAFGDSLSDNGNLYTATAGIVGSAGYYQGRFSNGPVWVEYLSQKLKLDMYNWAVAAAPSSIDKPSDYLKSVPYTLEDELANFTAHIANVGVTQDEMSKILFTVLFGGNNFVHKINDTPERVVEDTMDFVDALVSLGAKHILVSNLPDFSMAPKFNQNYNGSIDIRAKLLGTNRLLAERLREYKNSHPNVALYDIDLSQIFDDILKDPRTYHLTNLTDSCYTGGRVGAYKSSDICSEPETYLFWDELHPSTTVHCQTSMRALNIMFEKYDISKINFDFSNCLASWIH